MEVPKEASRGNFLFCYLVGPTGPTGLPGPRTSTLRSKVESYKGGYFTPITVRGGCEGRSTVRPG